MTACSVWACVKPTYKHCLCSFHYHQKCLVSRTLCTKTNCSKPLFLSLLCQRHFFLEYGKCHVKNCTEKPYCSQRCLKHYREKKSIRIARCKICHRKDFVNGYCTKHIVSKRCKVVGCTRAHRAKGLCTLHYFRFRRAAEKPSLNG